MRPRLSRWIALGAGSGLSAVAPGTAGTLWAWVVWAIAAHWLAVETLAVIAVLAFAIGPWACARTVQALGVHDHKSIVWDEVAAFWLVLAFVPASFGAQLWAFLLFRFFDIVKPPPIRRFDRDIGGGFGVMFDDLVAAFYTLLVFAAWKAWS